MSPLFSIELPTAKDLTQIFSSCHGLESELGVLWDRHQILHDQHCQSCSALLTNSVKALFKIMAYINKADKSVVEWHHRNRGLKLALRIVGLDRRTRANIDKKSAKLRTSVAEVEVKFQGAADAFAEGVEAANTLNEDFARFSNESVNSTYAETNQVLKKLETCNYVAKAVIREQQDQQNQLKSLRDETNARIQQARTDQSNAEARRDLFRMGAILGFGGAAIGAVLFPPSVMASASLVGGGLLSGKASLVCDASVDELKATTQNLNAALTRQESKIKQLYKELASLNEAQDSYQRVLEHTRDIQKRTRTLRAISQNSLGHIRCVQSMLHATHTRLEHILYSLQECQYAESRRDLANQLRSIINSIVTIGQKEKSLAVRDEDIAKATLALLDIDRKTAEVMDVFELVEGPHA